jgi:hypothetical protein
MGDVEVVAVRLGLESGRAIGGNAVAEDAVGPLELPGLSGFLRQFAVSPFAVDQNAHSVPPPWPQKLHGLR